MRGMHVIECIGFAAAPCHRAARAGQYAHDDNISGRRRTIFERSISDVRPERFLCVDRLPDKGATCMLELAAIAKKFSAMEPSVHLVRIQGFWQPSGRRAKAILPLIN